VKVRHDEGVATRIGPEPCAVCREAGGEASAGEYRPAIEPRKIFHPGCRRGTVCGRQHERARQREHPLGPAWSENLACVDAPRTGTGRSRVRPTARGRFGPRREGEEP
jgi:hypothetical protein